MNSGFAHEGHGSAPKVIFKVYKPGDPTKYKIVTLGNAIITKVVKGVKQPNTGKTNANSHEKGGTGELENFSFTFEKISVENITGSTSTSDDWTSNNQ